MLHLLVPLHVLHRDLHHFLHRVHHRVHRHVHRRVHRRDRHVLHRHHVLLHALLRVLRQRDRHVGRDLHELHDRDRHDLLSNLQISLRILIHQLFVQLKLEQVVY